MAPPNLQTLHHRQLVATSWARSSELCEQYEPKAYWMVCAGGLTGCCLSPSCSQCNREPDKLMVPIEALMDKEKASSASKATTGVVTAANNIVTTTGAGQAPATVTVMATSQPTPDANSQTNSTDPPPSSDSNSGSSLGTPIGATLGGVALVILIVFVFLLFRRRKNRRQLPPQTYGDTLSPVSPGASPMSETKSPLSFLAPFSKRFSRHSISGQTDKPDEYYVPVVAEMEGDSMRRDLVLRELDGIPRPVSSVPQELEGTEAERGVRPVGLSVNTGRVEAPSGNPATTHDARSAAVGDVSPGQISSNHQPHTASANANGTNVEDDRNVSR